MIVQAILDGLTAVVSTLLGFLPTTPAPPDIASGVSNAFGAAGGYMSIIALWFPVDELGSALAGLLLFLAGVTVFRLVSWVLALIHIGGIDS